MGSNCEWQDLELLFESLAVGASLERQLRDFAQMNQVLAIQSRETTEDEDMIRLAQIDSNVKNVVESEVRNAAKYDALQNLAESLARLSEDTTLEAREDELDKVRRRHARNVAENEARLKLFYESGEPEMTRNFEFIDCNSPIRIRNVGRKGRGVFLKEGVVAGQLIIVGTAIVSCSCNCGYLPYDENSHGRSPTVAWMPPSPRVPLEVQKHLTGSLREAHFRVIRMIPMLDSHVSPEDLLAKREANSDFPYSWVGYDNRDIDDEERLVSLVKNNAVCDKTRALSMGEPSQVVTCEFWGVWHIPSLINHSCTPNCHRMIVGDAMFVRAAKDIAAGDEVTVPYFDIFQPLAFRDRSCDQFGFRCECSRCSFERSIGKPYEEIQKKIFGLKIRLQATLATESVAEQGASLLHELGELHPAVDDLIKQLRRDALGRIKQAKQIKSDKQIGKQADQMHENKETALEKQKDVQPNSLSSPTSPSEESLSAELKGIPDLKCAEAQEISADFNMGDGKLANWLKASFMECYIALCSVNMCDTEIFAEENSWKLPQSPFWVKGAVTETGEARWARVIMGVAAYPLQVADRLHRGTLLGQEYYSILLNACSRYADLSDSAESEAASRLHLEHLEAYARHFFESYYGFPGSRVLTKLVWTDS